VIRALLTSEGEHAGIRHQLDEMVDLVPDENPIKPALRAIERLAAYATTYRYPTATGRIKASPDKAELDADIANVQRALDAAAAWFVVDLTRQGSPATHAKPPR
jgi:hypothetical protein